MDLVSSLRIVYHIFFHLEVFLRSVSHRGVVRVSWRKINPAFVAY